MSRLSEKGSFTSSFSFPSLLEVDEEMTSKESSQHNSSMRSNPSMQSLPINMDDIPPVDYRRQLLLKRNSTRNAWRMSDSDSSDDSGSEYEEERTESTNGENSPQTMQRSISVDRKELEVIEDGSLLSDTSVILLKITIPDQTLTKCLRIAPSETVWSAKQKVARSLAKKLVDPLNYGLFCNQLGCFLQEQKAIADYVHAKLSANYELRYKSRIYNHVANPGGEPRRVVKMQGDGKRKELMRYVRQHNVDKISRMLSKGIDPNFHSPPTGETPLTSVIANFAPGVSEAMSFEQVSLPVIRVLVLGGAHIDFRDQNGFTPLHVAVRNGNSQAVKILLNLGAPPDSYDNSELTPLYHCAMSSSSVDCIRPLYEAGANIKCVNSQKWTLLHQVCRYGRLDHLEVILDIVASSKGEEALLNMQNESGNTALHVCAIYSFQQCLLHLLKSGIDKSIRNYAHQDAFQVSVVARNMDVAKLIEDYSNLTDQEIFLLMQQHEGEKSKQTDRSIVRRHTFGPASHNKSKRPSHKDLFTREKESATVRRKDDKYTKQNSLTQVEEMGQAQSYTLNEDPGSRGELPGGPTTTSTTSDKPTSNTISTPSHSSIRDSSNNIRESPIILGNLYEEPISRTEGSATGTLTKRSSVDASSHLTADMNGSGGDVTLQPTSHPDIFHYYRDVTISKGNDGYGFVLRGAKADKSIENFSATARYPGLQYLESVEEGSNAFRIGLRAGDFILKINAIDVTCMGHRQTVDVIRKLRDPIRMRVVSVITKPIEPSTEVPNGDVKTSVASPETTSSSPPNSPDGKLRRSESIGSAIGKLDSVIAMEETNDVENVETTATLRRRPVSRIFRSHDIEEMFRFDGAVQTSQSVRNRESRSSTNSSSKRLVRVLPPTIPTSPKSTSSPTHEPSFNGQTSPPPPPHDRFHSMSSLPSGSTSNYFNSLPRDSGHVTSPAIGTDSRKPPPLPPERRDSRLSGSDSFQRSTSVTPQVTTTQTLGRTFAAPPSGRVDLSGFASQVASQAHQRRERSTSNEPSEKISSTPITHHLVSKAPPSVAKKPDRGKQSTPLPKVPDSPEEPKSALAIALAAKQASLRQRSQTVSAIPVSANTPPAFKPTVKSSYGKNEEQIRSELMLLPPPPAIPVSESVNPTFYNLPPPPPPTSQPDHFDPTLLPPPPDTMLTPKYASISKVNRNKETKSTFDASKHNDQTVSASSNGIDSGSSADSGVDEFTSHHRHLHGADAKSNVDNLSVVSSVSTMSSEDGSDPGVSLSYDPKSTGDQSTGNMYLGVLKKNRSQSGGGQATGGAVQLTKVSFSGSKTTTKPNAKLPSAEPIKSSASSRVAPPSESKLPPEPQTGGASGIEKPLVEWTVADVCKWLNDLGLDAYTSMFAENEIVGSHLPDLSKEDLQDLGVTRVGHRLTIERSLKKLSGK